MAWKSKEKIAIMEPLSLVSDVMSMVLREEGGLLIKGAVKNFSALFYLIQIRRLDVIFTEIYDEHTTIIEGVNYIREIKKRYPNIDLIIHTEIDMPALLVQSNADFIHMKKLSMNECRESLTKILKVGSMLSVLFHDSRKINYNYKNLSEIEWEILMLYSKGLKNSDIAELKETTVQSISRRKRIIMSKLNIVNNTAFKNFLALSGKKFGEYPLVKI